MKKIAVMGAGGFVGTNVTEYLGKRYETLPVTRKKMDLLDENVVMEFLMREQPDVVINCANQGGSRKTESAGEPVNIIGSNLKMFFAQERCLVAGMKMINFGSGAQYNKNRDLCKVAEHEFGEVIPKDDYGYSKYVMEQYIRRRNRASAAAGSGQSDRASAAADSGQSNRASENGVIYNPVIFGLYGAHEDYTFKFISNAILKNMLEMPIVINQNVVFDYLYIDDFLRIMEYIIEHDCPYREFNITPTESIDLVTIARLINGCGHYQSEIIVKNPGMNYQYTGDNARLLKNLPPDFAFTPYQKGIEQLYAYYEAHAGELDLDAIRRDELLGLCRTKG